jgi:hypothetical protein
MTDAEIDEFWTWFASVCGEFGPQFENTQLIEELDRRVTSLGELSWEIGPAPDADANALVVTPGGRADLLPLTKQIISRAPACDGWQFYAAKPPKQWNLRFTVEAGGSEIPIDASSWRHVLYKYPDGLFDIVVLATNESRLSDDIRAMAAEIVVEGQIGEELRIRLVNAIDVEEPVDAALVAKSSAVQVMRQQLLELAEHH